MKVTPLASGTGIPSAEVGQASTQRTSPSRIAAAKAIMAGETPPLKVSPSENNPPSGDRQVDRIRKIKMRTQVSPDRDYTQELQENEAVPAPVPPVDQTQNAISDLNETQTQATNEETRPLSPQFAALAKGKRALQLERERFEQEKAQHAQTGTDAGPALMARLKSDPLRVLQEAGVSYQELADAITSNPVNPELEVLKAEIKSLREGLDKTFVDRDAQAEQQVLSEMTRDAQRIVAEGDQYEMVRATKSVPDAIELIHRTYKKTGEVMDLNEALDLIEEDLINETLRIAQTPKLRTRLQPQEQEVTPQNPNDRTMRTLTNRDGATPALSRRARAMAAFNGQLKR